MIFLNFAAAFYLVLLKVSLLLIFAPSLFPPSGAESYPSKLTTDQPSPPDPHRLYQLKF